MRKKVREALRVDMRQMRKVVAFVVSICMLAGMTPLSVRAESGGDGASGAGSSAPVAEQAGGPEEIGAANADKIETGGTDKTGTAEPDKSETVEPDKAGTEEPEDAVQAALLAAVTESVAALRKNGVTADWKPDFVDKDGRPTANKPYFDKGWEAYLQLTDESKTAISQADRDYLELCALTVTGEDDECQLCREHGAKAYHQPSVCPYEPANVAEMERLIADEAALQAEMDVQPEKPASFFEKLINNLWNAYNTLVGKVKDIFSVNGRSAEEERIIAHREALTAELQSAETISAGAERLAEAVSAMENTESYIAENGAYIDQVWAQYQALYTEENLLDYIMFTFANWDTASETEAPVFSQGWETLTSVYRARRIAAGDVCADCLACTGMEICHLHDAGLTEECPNRNTLDSIPAELPGPDDKGGAGKADGRTEGPAVSESHESGAGRLLAGLLERATPKAYAAEPEQAFDEGTGTADGPAVIRELPSFFSGALKAASASYLPGMITAPDSTATKSQTIGGTNGEPYKLIVNPNGRISVWFDLGGNGRYDQKQYYGSDANSNGSVLVINGNVYGTDYLGGALIDNGHFAVSNTLTDGGRTVKTVFVNKSGVQVTQYVNLPKGANYINKRWEIINYNASGSISDLRFIHGGDTFFAGSDTGYCYYNRGTRSVYIKKNADSGMMSYIWDGAVPADRYFSGYYYDGKQLAMKGLLNNTAYHTANPGASYVDAGYFLQWDKASLGTGETWTIKSTEGFSLKGDVQIQAPAENTAAPGSLVSYRFTLMNMSDQEKTVDLTADSSNFYSADIRVINGVIKTGSGYRTTVPAMGSRTVIVDCEIPADAPDGTDKITLTGLYDGKTQTGSVTTTVNSEAIGFDRVVVVENKPSDSGSGGVVQTTIYAEINGKNLPTNAEVTLVAKLMKEDGTPTNIEGRVTVTTGSEKVDQIIGVIPLSYVAEAGTVYFAEVSVEKVVRYNGTPGTGTGTEVPVGTVTDAPSGPVTIDPEVAVKSVTNIEFTNGEIDRGESPQGQIKLYKDSTIKLEAVVTPVDATNPELEWSSSDYTVASVDENGKVTAVGSEGTAQITATAKDHSGVSCTVTVKVNVKPERITFDAKDITLEKGKSIELTATVHSESVSLDAGDILLEVQGNGAGTSYLEIGSPIPNGNKATVSVTAKESTPVGYPVEISAVIDKAGVNISDTAAVRVVEALPTGIRITSGEAIESNVAGGQVTVGPGQTIPLGALISPAEAANSMGASDVTWTTDRPDLIALAAAGSQPLGIVAKTAADKTGDATVTVRINGTNYEDTLRISVSTDVTDISVYPGDQKVGQGEKIALAIDFQPVYALPPTVLWSVSGPAVWNGSTGYMTVDADAEPGAKIEVTARTQKDAGDPASVLTAGAVYTVEARVRGLKVTGSGILNIGSAGAQYEVIFDPSGLADDQKEIMWVFDETKLKLEAGCRVTDKAVTFRVLTSAAVGSTAVRVISSVNKDVYGLKSIMLENAPFAYAVEKQAGGAAASSGGFYTEDVKLVTSGMQNIRALLQKVSGSALTVYEEEKDYTAEEFGNLRFGDGTWRVSVKSGLRNDGVITGAETIVLKVDTGAPTLSALTVTGAGATLSGGRVETTGKLTVSAEAKDSSSGVKAVQYSINGGADWIDMAQLGSTSTWQAEISQTFTGTIQVRAQDKAGHDSAELTQPAMITGAAEAPVLEVADSQGQPVADGAWNRIGVTVSARGGSYKEGGLTYTLTHPADTGTPGPDTAMTSAGGVYSVTVSQQGITRIVVTAEDVSGNRATAGAVVRIDGEKPQISNFEVTGPAVREAAGKVYATGQLKISAAIMDGDSGLGQVTAKVTSGSGVGAVELAAPAVTENNGSYSFIFDEEFDGAVWLTATDKAGNTETVSKAAMIASPVKAPTVTLTDAEGTELITAGAWTKGDVTVKVSGPAGQKLMYSAVGAAASEKTDFPSGGLTVTRSGITTLTAIAADVSGAEAETRAVIMIDKVRPVIGGMGLNGEGGVISGGAYYLEHPLTITAAGVADSHSGVKEVCYNLVTQGVVKVSGQAMTLKDGVWSAVCTRDFDGWVEICAVDNVGNTQVISKAAVLSMDWALIDPLTQEIVDGVFGPGNAVLNTGSGTPVIQLQGDVELDKTIKAGTDVIIDLNGHDIAGADGAEGENGQAAITIIEDGVTVTITNSANANAAVTGGSGGAGGSGSANGGNGGHGVDAGSHTGCNVIVSGNTTVAGGNGGNGYSGGNGSGGNGGSGVSSEADTAITIERPAKAQGGDGGNAAGTGAGGNGGAGVDSETGNVIVNGGGASGGNGGEGAGSGIGGSGGNTPGGDGAGSPGSGGQAIDGGSSSTIKQNTGSDGYKVTTTINTSGAAAFAPAGELAAAAVSEADKATGAAMNIEVILTIVHKTDKPDRSMIEGETALGGIAANTVGAYFDISLKKIVTDSNGQSVETTIKTTQGDQEVEITIGIPQAMQGGSNYTIIRVHDGRAEALPARQVGDKLIFRTNRFSTYAIAYTQAPSKAVRRQLTIEGGGAGSTVSDRMYDRDSLVRIDAGTMSGHTFSGWTVSQGGITLADGTRSVTYFTMPDEAVTLVAGWTANRPGGNGGSGGSGGGGGSAAESSDDGRVKVETGNGGKTEIRKNADGSSTLTVTPDAGFRVKDVLVDGKSVGSVTSYTFPAGEKKYTVQVVFEKVAIGTFADVSGHWAEDYIRSICSQGLMAGTGADTFGPEIPMSRGMVVTVLYKLAGKPETAIAGSAFRDVAADAYYADAVAWAQESGIVAGYGNGLFKPEQSVTRQEFAQILFSYAKASNMDLTAGEGAAAGAAGEQSLAAFADADSVAGWAREAMESMVAQGVMSGTPQKELQPERSIVRAEAASMLYHFVDLKK
ncbi:S-layer homology domain-containing protein [Bacilliculturomica massiliensis]|uniref:S-layer homology domain-containing protein n=1 Tax=Bacilliculturomica massiliensis TaxID=1917867 RepID=UPI00103022F8|nr:S-layer homology domain-containing protein [Bacilliculturomica massiliensis]